MSKKQASEQRVKNLLDELEELLKEVGWTKNDLAIKVAQSDSKIDQNSEYERIRKLFNRLPKKTDRIRFYISFIIEHRDNKNRNFCKLPELDNFDEDQKAFLEGIVEISKAFFANNKK